MLGILFCDVRVVEIGFGTLLLFKAVEQNKAPRSSPSGRQAISSKLSLKPLLQPLSPPSSEPSSLPIALLLYTSTLDIFIFVIVFFIVIASGTKDRMKLKPTMSYSAHSHSRQFKKTHVKITFFEYHVLFWYILPRYT
jgi:hypothetical protein